MVRNAPALELKKSLYNTGISSNVLPTPYSSAITFCPSQKRNFPAGTAVDPETVFYSEGNNFGLVGNCTKVAMNSAVAQNKLMSYFSDGANFPTLPVTATSVTDVSDYLLNNNDKYQASTVGAYRYVYFNV